MKFNIFYIPEYLISIYFLYLQYLFNFNIEISVWIYIFIILNIFYKNYLFKIFYIFLFLFFAVFYKYFYNFFNYDLFIIIFKKIYLIILIFFLYIYYFNTKYLNINVFYKLFLSLFSLILLVRCYEVNIYGCKYLYFGNINDIFIFFIIFNIIFYFIFYYKYKIIDLENIFFFYINLNIYILFYNKNLKYGLNLFVNPILNNFFIKLHVPILLISYSLVIIASLLNIFTSFLKMKIFNKLKYIKLSYLFYSLSFILFTLGNILGSLWAKISWGSYWNWDPKEIWSLILWIFYLIWLHIYNIKKYNILNYLSGLILIITYFLFFGINYFYKNSLHVYGKF